MIKQLAKLAGATAATIMLAGFGHTAQLAAASSPVTVDVLPAIHTYGVNVGTDTHYCFADLVSWHPIAGCESAN